MEELKFDFNNMLDYNVGKVHGVTKKDLSDISPRVYKAHAHLRSIINSSENRKRLGLEWTQLPYQGRKLITEIQSLGNDIARGFENVLFLGIGGSYLGLKAAQDALCEPYYNEFAPLRRKRPRIYFEGNNLDPDTLSTLLPNLNPKKTFVVVISKSGETTEPKAAFMVAEAWLKKKVGKLYGRQIVAITDPEDGSLRKKVNEQQKKDPYAFRSLPILKGVSGRYSELNMGLLHLAVVGIDIQQVLFGAQAMQKRCSEPTLLRNPAYLYAVLHTILYQKKHKSVAVLMPFSETLKSTAEWYIQLLAECLGKKFARKIRLTDGGREEWIKDTKRILNVGRTPVAARGTNDLHSIQQNNIEGEYNKVITFILVRRFKHEVTIPADRDDLAGRRFSRLITLAQEATEWALTRESRPNCTIIMPEVSAYHWGGLLFFFEMATAFEGELLNINTFDQPGVDSYKNYMYYKLGRQGIPKDIARDIERNTPLKKAKYIL